MYVGGLIKRIEIPEEEVSCAPQRTVVLPIKYKSMGAAMGTCSALAGAGEYLRLDTFQDWVEFYSLYRANPAIDKYCGHDGRWRLWLPYEGFSAEKGGEPGTFNVTHYRIELSTKVRKDFTTEEKASTRAQGLALSHLKHYQDTILNWC